MRDFTFITNHGAVFSLIAGTRLRGEDLDIKGIRGVVITYDTLTGKKILSV